jgi:hypothetical protein
VEENNERESGIEIIAKTIMDMKYAELVLLAEQLVNMQKGAKDDGWEWLPGDVHGEFGLINMLHCWAEGVDLTD